MLFNSCDFYTFIFRSIAAFETGISDYWRKSREKFYIKITLTLISRYKQELIDKLSEPMPIWESTKLEEIQSLFVNFLYSVIPITLVLISELMIFSLTPLIATHRCRPNELLSTGFAIIRTH